MANPTYVSPKHFYLHLVQMTVCDRENRDQIPLEGGDFAVVVAGKIVVSDKKQKSLAKAQK